MIISLRGFEQYHGSGWALLICKDERPEKLLYLDYQDDKDVNDFNFVEELSKFDLDLNHLFHQGRSVYFGMSSAHEFIVKTDVLELLK